MSDTNGARPAGPFTDADRRQLEAQGSSLREAERQLELFRHPPPPVHLARPATAGDGVRRLGTEDQRRLRQRFRDAIAETPAVRMVPASGAASRMFKDLSAWLETNADEDTAPLSGAVETFLEHLNDLPFRDRLAEAAGHTGRDLADLRRDDPRALLRLLLDDDGLGFAERPKALIPFHRYPDGETTRARTPLTEHLVESAAHLADAQGCCRLHFTVAPEWEGAFRDRLAAEAPAVEDRFGVRFAVTFSHQSHATDTLAVTPEDRPFRLEDGSLLLRPGGHGALLPNLAALGQGGARLAFLKNIDNVVPESRQPLVVAWKEVLGGLLVELTETAHALAHRLSAPAAAADPGSLDEAGRFLDTVGRPPSPDLATAPGDERRRILLDGLERPIRVCGMVVNEGEPGGGPFWVRSADGRLSLQIVETSQIDTADPRQAEVVGSATHFNPVDLACSLADRNGRPWDLDRFVDPGTVFIAERSHQGRPLKALEKPGLWNGAMAGWNTVFVEVPLATFAPVKTVLDLLRPEHQGG